LSDLTVSLGFIYYLDRLGKEAECVCLLFSKLILRMDAIVMIEERIKMNPQPLFIPQRNITPKLR